VAQLFSLGHLRYEAHHIYFVSAGGDVCLAFACDTKQRYVSADTFLPLDFIRIDLPGLVVFYFAS
jgi:hypothetical protein